MRVAKWDNLKFILMLFVVFGHFVNEIGDQSSLLLGLWLFVYTFHIPAFLFVSGLFSKRTIHERRYEKMFPYLFLYLFMEVLRFVVFSCVDGSPHSFQLLSEGGVPWFSLVLFWCYLVTTCFHSVKRSYLLIFAVCLGMVAGYDSSLGDFLCGMRFFTFYPFFLLGYCIPLERVTEWTERKSVKIAAALCLLATLAVCFLCSDQLRSLKNFLRGRYTYRRMGLLPYGGIYRGVYYVIAFVLILCVIAVIPDIQCVITAWGQRTVQVFALHYPIIYILIEAFHMDDVLKAAFPNGYGWIVLLLTCVLTVLLSLKVWSPFFEWLMKPVQRQKETGQL